jgi:hypothetical protein
MPDPTIPNPYFSKINWAVVVQSLHKQANKAKDISDDLAAKGHRDESLHLVTVASILEALARAIEAGTK